MNCEACDEEPATESIANAPDAPFELCGSCSTRVKARSLRPLEWFRLASRHGPQAFLLHDDFYDELGVALQPLVPVIDAELYPYPASESWSLSAALALDVAFTRSYPPDVALGLFSHAPQETLARIEAKLAQRRCPHFEFVALKICARSLFRVAEVWVRAQWSHAHERDLSVLAEASAACLPHPEGLERTLAFVHALPEEKRREGIVALSWFSDARVLDAIEALVPSSVTEEWGRTAAASGLTWARARAWLDAGRPLSLVALDALLACVSRPTLQLRQLQPKLLEPADVAELRRRLEACRARDPVLRVDRAVDFLLANVQTLRNGNKRPDGNSAAPPVSDPPPERGT